MNNFQEFIPNVHFELIPIKNLVSNQEYQRNLSTLHVRRAAENFNIFQINPIKISRRDGINYVFNGQHTIEIIALVSGSRETPVWCMIYDELDYVQEADIFANQMKYVKPLLPYEVFMANVEAGNDKQLIIKSMVESYGLKITKTKKIGGICAVNTLEKIYDRYGFHVLNRVLRLCVGTWEGDNNSFSANILSGISHLVAAYKDELKDDIFKLKLGGVSIKELSRIGKERRNGSMGYTEAMLDIYNKKMKAPLRWMKLYEIKDYKIDAEDDVEQ